MNVTTPRYTELADEYDRLNTESPNGLSRPKLLAFLLCHAAEFAAALREVAELRCLLAEAEHRAIFPGGVELRNRIRARLAVDQTGAET